MMIARADHEDTRMVRQSYADQVYQYIRESILSGELRQGEKIVEEKIAKHFGVSRTPIREALTRLQAYGLVHLEPRSYAQVAQIGSREASDIAHLRLTLEQMAFRQLCAQKTDETLATLYGVAERAKSELEQGNKAGYFEADSDFHQTAAELCGNGELGGMYRHFAGRVQLLRIAQDVPLERLEIYMRQHFDLVEMVINDRCTAIDELLRIHIVHDLSSGEGAY